MKQKFLMACLLGALCTGLLPPLGMNTAKAQEITVSYQTFYDQLSPYGAWVDYPGYGYAWAPAGLSGFRPYASGGHWVYTEDGWTWASDYSWGWAPFHYGNWVFDKNYGWLWIPGYDWAPAWVAWGEYNGNYCWAPIGPGIRVSFGSYRPPYYCWTSVPCSRITSVHLGNYYSSRMINSTVVNRVTVINNVNRGGRGTYWRGPAAASVEKFTHSTIRPVAVRESGRPGAAHVQNGQLTLYRPNVKHNGAFKPAPSRIRDIHTLNSGRSGEANQNPSVRPSQRPSNTGNNHPADHQRQPVQQQHLQDHVNVPNHPNNNPRPGSSQPNRQPVVHSNRPETHPSNQPSERRQVEQPSVQRQQQPVRQRPQPVVQQHTQMPAQQRTPTHEQPTNNRPVVRNNPPPPQHENPREHH